MRGHALARLPARDAAAGRAGYRRQRAAGLHHGDRGVRDSLGARRAGRLQPAGHLDRGALLRLADRPARRGRALQPAGTDRVACLLRAAAPAGGTRFRHAQRQAGEHRARRAGPLAPADPAAVRTGGDRHQRRADRRHHRHRLPAHLVGRPARGQPDARAFRRDHLGRRRRRRARHQPRAGRRHRAADRRARFPVRLGGGQDAHAGTRRARRAHPAAARDARHRDRRGPDPGLEPAVLARHALQQLGDPAALLCLPAAALPGALRERGAAADRRQSRGGGARARRHARARAVAHRAAARGGAAGRLDDDRVRGGLARTGHLAAARAQRRADRLGVHLAAVRAGLDRRRHGDGHADAADQRRAAGAGLALDQAVRHAALSLPNEKPRRTLTRTGAMRCGQPGQRLAAAYLPLQKFGWYW
ncbi:hypothetical protein BGLA2_30105 [Burkholderia gladioli]|nr:hypothetical protein BGLA2_30105 [Burkholderia gladioli]